MNGCDAHTPEGPYAPPFCLMAHMPTSYARARRLYFPGLSNCLPGVLSPNPSNFPAHAEGLVRLGYHVSMKNQERTSEAAVNGERESGPSPDPFTETVAQTVAAHDLLPAGSAIVVAVSGGADSIALLTALQQLAPRHHWQLHVGHVNHQLRGAESDADAEFVAQTAARAGLPCTVRSIDVGRAQTAHASPENTARRLRYRALSEFARAVDARFIALAHHQDDQAETVLLHLLRGSGLGGLAGMRYASPLLLAGEAEPACKGRSADSRGAGGRVETETTITLVRPLLAVARADIRAYCQRRHLAFREDRSNETTAPQRNWLRHAVLPLLETRYPQAARTLARAAHIIEEDYAYLTETAEKWLRQNACQFPDGMLLDHPAWRILPPALQSSILRCAVAAIAGHTQGLEHTHVLHARATLRAGRAGVASPLPGGLSCRAEHDGIWIGYSARQESFSPIELSIPGRTAIAPLQCSILAALVEPNRDSFCKKTTTNEEAWLDAAQVGGLLRVRTRLRGDRFVPLGMTGAKKLQDFLLDARVPARLRDRVPLVVTEENAIVWVAGYRIDARYRITAQTRQVVHLRLQSSQVEEKP